MACNVNYTPEKGVDLYVDCYLVLADGSRYKGLFTDLKGTDTPEGYKRYEIRHSDSDEGRPATVERFVHVNYYGTFFSEKELPLEEDYKEPEYTKNFLEIKDLEMLW